MNGFLEVCECSETVYIFFCGKHNLAKGVYDLKNIVNGQLQYFIHCVLLIQCLVSLLSCKQCFDYFGLCCSEHLYTFGRHTQSPEWHGLVMSMHNFITRVTDSQILCRKVTLPLVNISVFLHSC